jgi:hypothetical protein
MPYGYYPSFTNEEFRKVEWCFKPGYFTQTRFLIELAEFPTSKSHQEFRPDTIEEVADKAEFLWNRHRGHLSIDAKQKEIEIYQYVLELTSYYNT